MIGHYPIWLYYGLFRLPNRHPSHPHGFIACLKRISLIVPYVTTSLFQWEPIGISQVPDWYVQDHAMVSDPGRLLNTYQSAFKNAVFPLYEQGRPLRIYIFRGSIPSLSLWPNLSILSASICQLPFRLGDSVRHCWLDFTSVGFEPTVSLKLPLAHSYKYFTIS